MYKQKINGQMIKLLKDFNISAINLRARLKLNEKTLNKIIKLDGTEEEQISKFVNENNLWKETMYTTFNQPKEEIDGLKAFSDASIAERRFILLDFDPKRESGVSSTDDEKKAAFNLKNEVKDYLVSKRLVNLIEADSGNGLHILIPITEGVDAESSKDDTRKFLRLLAKKFNDEKVDLDTSVGNASRITKLYGTIADKGKNTKERPHRNSKLITTKWTTEANSFDLVQQVIEELQVEFDESNENQSSVANNKEQIKPYVYADASAWLNHYDLGYREKEGEVEGFTIFVLDKCPLKTHSTNETGASLQQTSDGKIMFTCLHKSHENFTINDFKKTYPIPNEARQQLSVQFLEDGNSRIIDEYKINKNGVYRYIKEDYVKLFEPIFISEQKRVIESNEIEMKLNYWSDGEWLSRWIKGSDLSVGEFKKLSQYALPVFPRAENDMISFLLKQKSHISVNDLHKVVGWGSVNQFLLSENFDNSDKKSFFEESRLLKLSTRGSYSKWLEMVENHVLGNSGSELGLAIGFSSIVVGYLARKNDQVRSLVCSAEGTSSTGKTTMQTMCAYLYSSKGLLDSFNATENSIIEKLNNNFGLAYMLDEYSSNTLNNTTRFLYQLSSGMSRMKLDSSSNIREQAEFSTTILTTSEISIRDSAASLGGIDVRILPFKDIQWTKSAESSNEIKKLSAENSGVAAVEFMTRLFDSNHHELINEFYELAQITLSERFEDHRFKSRLVDQYAMLLCAVYLVKSVLDIELDEEGIINHLSDSYLSITEGIVENDVDYKDILVKTFNRSKNALKAGDAIYDKQLPMRGRYYSIDGIIKVQFFNSEFKKDLLYELDGKTVDEAISDIYKLGLFNHEKGRRTKRVRIDGIQYTVFEFEIELNKEKNKSPLEVASAITTIKDDIDEL